MAALSELNPSGDGMAYESDLMEDKFAPAGPPTSSSPSAAANEPTDDSPCNLIVKYLPDSIDEEGLRKLFAPYGTIVKAKLIKDKDTGRSKGYGFVKFDREASAAKATQQLNGYRIENKTLRVSVANPLAAQHRQTNVYVACLPKSFSKERVETLFKPFGAIVETKILTDKVTGMSRGVAFINFEHSDDATRAITSLNGTIPDGCSEPLQARFARVKTPVVTSSSPYSLLAAAAAAQQSMVLNYAARAQTQRYNPYGAPQQAANRQNNQRGYSSNNATFSPAAAYPPSNSSYGAQGAASPYSGLPPASAAAAPAAAAYPTYDFSGQGASYDQSAYSAAAAAAQVASPYAAYAAAFAPPPSAQQADSSADTTLFVFHLPPLATDLQVMQLFSAYGAVTRVDIVKDPSTGRNKGYCFVHMQNAQQAQNAISALNGYNFFGKYLKVAFKTKK